VVRHHDRVHAGDLAGSLLTASVKIPIAAGLAFLVVRDDPAARRR